MEDDFYATIKFKNGEEIFAKVAVSEEENRTMLVLSNPVMATEVKAKGGLVGYKVEPWLKTTKDDMFIINSYDKFPVLKRLKKYSRHEIPSQLNLFPVKFSGGKSILSKSFVIFFSPYYFIKILMIIMKIQDKFQKT